MKTTEIPRLHQVQDKLNQTSPTLCLAKWLQTTLHLYNGNTQSCHHVKSHRIPLKDLHHNPSGLHNTAYKKSIRAKMLKGSRPSECRYCWNVEDQDQYSDRIYKSGENWALPHLNTVLENKDQGDIFPTYVELAFDNICNFKCMYCSPAYSTAWEAEIKKHGAYPTSRRFNSPQLMKLNKVNPLPEKSRTQYIEAFWRWWPELSPHLKYLRVTGGEPLLTKDTWKVLEHLKQQTRPELNFAINSNLSTPAPLMKQLIESINSLEGKVKSFSLYCSIDSTGVQAEYIRYGLNYKQFVANTEQLLSEVRWPISLSYMITVNALCLPGLKSLMELIADQRQRFPQHHIGVDTPYLHHPEHMSVKILPPSFQSYIWKATDFMKALPHIFCTEEIQRLERIAALMGGSRYGFIKRQILRHDFYRMFKEYDRRRGTHFLQTFPEYQNFWKLCRAFSVLQPLISRRGL